MKPNFLCVGAAKSGTTSLHDILIQHPDIYIPLEKDFHFFDNKENYAKGLDWYLNYFKSYSGQKISGEIAATYLYDPEAPQRIKETLGSDCKIIFILRNPAKRSYSEFLHHFRTGTVSDKYEDYLNNNYPKNKYLKDPNYLFYQRSCYTSYINNYLEHFSADQVHFVIMEELFAKPEEVLGKLNQFLGVDEFTYDLSVKSNEGFIPTSIGMNKMIQSKSPLKRIVKGMLPSYKFRRKVKLFLINLNKSSKQKDKVKLSEEKYADLNDTYFTDEIKSIEQLLNRKIHPWNYEKKIN